MIVGLADRLDLCRDRGIDRHNIDVASLEHSRGKCFHQVVHLEKRWIPRSSTFSLPAQHVE